MDAVYDETVVLEAYRKEVTRHRLLRGVKSSSLHACHIDAERVSRNTLNGLEDLALSCVEHPDVPVATGRNDPVFSLVFAHTEGDDIIDFSGVKAEDQIWVNVIRQVLVMGEDKV